MWIWISLCSSPCVGLAILLPQPPPRWDYRHTLPHTLHLATSVSVDTLRTWGLFGAIVNFKHLIWMLTLFHGLVDPPECGLKMQTNWFFSSNFPIMDMFFSPYFENIFIVILRLLSTWDRRELIESHSLWLWISMAISRCLKIMVLQNNNVKKNGWIFLKLTKYFHIISVPCLIYIVFPSFLPFLLYQRKWSSYPYLRRSWFNYCIYLVTSKSFTHC